MVNYRLGRVRQEILREVNDILMNVVKDPRVKDVTITDIDLTGDLQHAKIFYSTLSDLASQRQKTADGLKAVTGMVRSELGKRLSLYKAPEIIFERDESVDYGNKIDKLLQQLRKESQE